MGEPKPEPPHEPKIKVVDRRKFTASGEPLEVSSHPSGSPDSAAPAEETPESSQRAHEPSPPEVPPTATEGTSPTLFLELVAMLASQAELLLIGTDDFPAQPVEAQRMIDYLGALESKTTGNLSGEEANVLSSVLYQLRTTFLQRK